jgi:transposase
MERSPPVSGWPRIAELGGIVVVLGVDIGKADFHCALVGEDGKPKAQSFPNSQVGFERLRKWLMNRKVERVHACMEATGGWSEELAFFLHKDGHPVSIVNPLVIKAFGQSLLSRTKTDKADAALIARYCAAMKPDTWQPPTAAQRRLQQLVRRRASLIEMVTQERNRFEAPGGEAIRPSIEGTITFLERQIEEIDTQIRSSIDDDPTLRDHKNRLESITGIGERTATTLLGEIPNITKFASAKALCAFVGACPREERSGTSVSRSWLSKVGNRAVRQALYFPAIAAMRFNPVLAPWAKQLRARGKRPKQVIAAVMRRLLVLAYGVLRSGKSFDPAITA